jgi:hypothetical protein
MRKLTIWMHSQGKERSIAAFIRNIRLYVATVVASIDVLQGRKIEGTIIRHKHTFILLHKIWEVVTGPVIFYSCTTTK